MEQIEQDLRSLLIVMLTNLVEGNYNYAETNAVIERLQDDEEYMLVMKSFGLSSIYSRLVSRLQSASASIDRVLTSE